MRISRTLLLCFVVVKKRIGRCIYVRPLNWSAHSSIGDCISTLQQKTKSETNLEKAYCLVRNWTGAECETCVDIDSRWKPFVHRYVIMIGDSFDSPIYTQKSIFVQFTISCSSVVSWIWTYTWESRRKHKPEPIQTTLPRHCRLVIVNYLNQ